ncbi:MAG: hypothetical protein J6Q83_02820 [Clostridia bacterium]|nr:hypothetical protein [Clostridia bacterium]
MLELNYALNLIIKGIEGTLSDLGFQVEYPEGIQKPELPVATIGNKSVIMYRGEKGRVRIEYENNKLALFIARADESDAPDDDMPRISLSLLELESFDERDLKYIFEEYIETLEKNFSNKNSMAGKKLPTPVSRTQAKSGALSYDANTLGSRFTTIYPELRDEYKLNIETYGEFLAEDFFTNHGNALVIETIRENDKVKMRKLFNLLNDIYEDGTNDTQSLVGVTILGVSLADNPELIDNAKSYFSDTMNEPVSEIINYLRKSKGARMRLDNPPVYKPKKEKKKGMLSSMLGM